MDQVQDDISKTETLLSDSEKKLKELTEDDTEVNPFKEKLDTLQEKFGIKVRFCFVFSLIVTSHDFDLSILRHS